MAPPNLFKLEKLKIVGYADRERTRELGTVEAMFNPQSFSQTYRVKYRTSEGIQSSDSAAGFLAVGPEHLSLSLLFDGTGVTEAGLPAGKAGQPVQQRVTDFLKLAHAIQGATHEPAYLTVRWGVLDFPCRLAKATVSYTAFGRDGSPLRAELSADFVADQDAQLTAKRDRKSSPDVSHSRVVKTSDTLSQLTSGIYDTPAHYVQVARVNGLDNLRRLPSGRILRFPPLGDRTGEPS